MRGDAKSQAVPTEWLEIGGHSTQPFCPQAMLTRARPELKQFARRLLAYETASRKPSAAKDSEPFGVFGKLRGPLGRFIGIGGFHALLSRALALAGAEVPSLGALQPRTDYSLEGLKELEAKLDSLAVEGGQVVLLAQLLGLLMTFIGRSLTLQLLGNIWPKLDELDFKKDLGNEEE
jgi:hypothetical protein